MRYSPGTTLTGTKGTRVTVESELDGGGFGIVYEGKTSKWGKCVIKQSFPVDIKEKKLKVERKVLERLGNHPQIPSLIDYNERKSPPFIVTSYINGENLKSKLKKQNGSFKTLPENKVKDYGIKLLNVLNYLHQQDNPVKHRDVKPENVMVNFRDEVHLIDYGTAVVEWDGLNISGKTQILTPGFGAPEQGSRYDSVDVRSDIYGVGTTMFFLLTGQDLCDDTTRKQCTEGRGINTRLKKPSHFNSSVSKKIDEIVRKATEIDPDDRYQTSQEMITELKGQASSGGRRGAELQLGGKTYSLDSMLRPGQKMTIGRKHGVSKANVKNDIQLESSYVSDIHAEIKLDKSGNYWLRDKGSKNGTAVNPGKGWNELSRDQSWNLHSGDKIALAYDKNKGPCITLIFRET